MTSLLLPHGQHYGPLRAHDGVAAVTTHTASQVETRVGEALEKRAILVIEGRVGTGKSFSLARALERLSPPLELDVVWLEMAAALTGKAQLVELYVQVSGLEPARSVTQRDVLRLLREALTERPRVLVLDEAQLSKPNTLSLLRWLHEPVNADFALVLAGTPGLWDAMPPELKSRTAARVRTAGIAENEAAEVLSAYHPIFAAADPNLLVRLNRYRARGSWRWWAKFLDRAIDYLPLIGAELTDATVPVIEADMEGG